MQGRSTALDRFVCLAVVSPTCHFFYGVTGVDFMLGEGVRWGNPERVENSNPGADEGAPPNASMLEITFSEFITNLSNFFSIETNWP